MFHFLEQNVSPFREKTNQTKKNHKKHTQNRKNLTHKKKNLGNIMQRWGSEGGIIVGRILMMESRANRQPQFYRVHAYCRQLHNLPRTEMPHEALTCTTVNSFEASSSPLTLHCHPHRDTPLSSLRSRVNHWRKLCAVPSHAFSGARAGGAGCTLHACCSTGPQWESCDLSQQHAGHMPQNTDPRAGQKITNICT